MKYSNWIGTFLDDKRPGYTVSQMVALEEFAAWLDTHGPTLRAADQPEQSGACTCAPQVVAFIDHFAGSCPVHAPRSTRSAGG